ncbi:MAG: hypothetical protein K9L56_13250 [Clostridiales bacterium]|nr:hypothetical protein [Clostridiales bacterium]
MTNDGLTRLTELFKNDIVKVEYDVDGVTNEQTTLNLIQTNSHLEVEFFIPSGKTGLIDNFKLIGTMLTLDIRNKNFNKVTDDAQKVTLPYKIEVKAV